jgi:uncharacterized membrane protein
MVSDKDEQPQDQLRERLEHMGGQHYYTELIRIISVLFVGVLALMTFLLTVGVQRPHASFAWALYTAIGVLTLNLLAYVFGHMFADQVKQANADDKAKFALARKRLKMVRFTQQLLFMLAVLAVAWMAVEAAHFFFSIPASSGPATQ